MNYYLTHKNKRGFEKILERINESGIDAYNYYQCIPRQIITLKEKYNDYDKGHRFIYYENLKNKDIELMNLLCFGFEGLITSDEKINEIENFGKYGCIIYPSDQFDIPEDITEKEDYNFV